jgi:exo-beta-1,3-glucanase (GH17 family)
MRLLSKTVATLLRLGALSGALVLGACSSTPDSQPAAQTWSIPDGGTDYGAKVDPLAYDWVNAVAYSGYRDGQSPNTNTYPTNAQILQDFQLVDQQWKMIRGYRVIEAQQAIDVIRTSDLPIKVFMCAWIGSQSSANDTEVAAAIQLANDPQYAPYIAAVIVGNEAQVSWSDHLVPTTQLIAEIQKVKAAISQPVTVADNWYWWSGGDANGGSAPAVANEIDFILGHFYPQMEEVINGTDTGNSIADAMARTITEYEQVQARFPGKYIAIGEAGWATAGSFSQTLPGDASPQNQKTYYPQLTSWAQQNNVLAFWFEAFDENWKDPTGEGLEAHWGLFTAERQPKPAISQFFP